MSARNRVASGFEDFLAKFVSEVLDQAPHYPARG